MREIWRKKDNHISEHGQNIAVAVNPFGSRYEGELLNHRPAGYGVCTFTAQQNPIFSQYVGLWSQGLRHGKGTLFVRDSGASIVGTWNAGFLVEQL